MYIYNVTVKVDHGIKEAWLQWLKQEHIPDVMLTNCFTSFKIVRLLEIDESEGPTFAIQYYADSIEEYNKYIDEYATNLRQKTIAKWGNKFIAFRTLMEIVQ